MVAFSEWQQHQFDCNIQQVKRTEFEVLYYGLFFSDCIKIFRIESTDVKENLRGGRIYYSDFQHKGNVGEGQFHINPTTLQVHLDHYLYKTLTYDELYELLSLCRGLVEQELLGRFVSRDMSACDSNLFFLWRL